MSIRAGVREHKIGRDKFHHKWDNSLPPAVEIEPGDVVHFDTEEVTAGQLKKGDPASKLGALDFNRLYPLGGPVYGRGAEPGDALEVEILELKPGSWRWTALLPGLGLLASDFPDPCARYFDLGDRTSAELRHDVHIPITPFCGTRGVATDDKGPIDVLPPTKGAGNIDTRHLTAGTKLYLPVFVPGGMFSAGDCHAAQGDGEVCVTGIECPMSFSLRFGVVKGGRLRPWSYYFLTPPKALQPRSDAAGYLAVCCRAYWVPPQAKLSTTQLGRYPIEAELGRGAMGVVYRSTHPRLDIPVAIKVLAEQYSGDVSFRQRFHREAATVASLNHPGIVRVYDFDEDGPVLFIVMEWVEGRSMRSWLDEYGRFSVDVSVDLLQQLLSPVGVAHDLGGLHPDIQPDNILISNRGKTKILDFGISKLVDDKQRLTATGSMVGTPAYMGPEQVKGETVDARADIYSLGMILYELLHGEPPFTGQLPAVLHSQGFDRPRPSTAIPSPIMDIIWKATAKDRGARFQSCEESSGAFHSMPKPAAAQPPMEAVSNESPVMEQVAHASPVPVHGSKPPGVCTHSECGERRGWACAYKDLMGRECKSWWCRRHITFIERTPFCPRHASVIRALAPTAGTIFEIKNRPAVDHRPLPLAALVAEDIDKDVTELVRRRYQNRKDVVLATDRTVRQTWAGRTEVAWERSWAALKSQGYLIRIAIRVSVAEPDHVQLLIGNTVVFKEVPDWIHRRREGEPPDHADRARFAKKIFAAVLEHVDEPTPLPPLTSGGGGPQIEPPPPPEI